MTALKTKQTEVDVREFINSFAETEQKRADSFELLKLMQDFTGYEGKMWGRSMIGFGCYHKLRCTSSVDASYDRFS